MHLRIFGGASVEGESGPLRGRAAQRHRLALLSLLALHPRITREKTIAYLWPSATETRGRRLLSDSIYRIHRAVGCEAIVAAGEELRLDTDCLPCDASEFREAMKMGEFERAVELYGGPLLDGFFLPEAAEFERWSSRMRDELATDHRRAIEGLARAAEEEGDVAASVRWWRRLARVDPLSSRVTLGLMKALSRAGDSGTAIRQARRHARLLEEELGASPDPAVGALVERLRRDPPSTPLAAGSDASKPGAPPDPPPRPVPEPGRTSREQEEIRPAGISSGGGPAPSSREGAAPPADGPPPADVSAATGRLVGGRRVRLVPIAGIGGVFIMLAAAFVIGSLMNDRGGPIGIAVLPFADLSPGGEHAHFADGISEELIAVLGAEDGLRVVARTSSFAFRERDVSARRIGRELDVGTILEGSVRILDERLRVTAQLVDVESGYHLWSETYQRRIEDVFQIQDEIVRSIVSTLRGRLISGSSSIATAPRIDVEAYNLYLRGRFLWHRRTGPDLRSSARVLEEAVAMAPDYARAHVGLGDAYAVLGFYDLLPPNIAFPGAKSAAMRALELDPTLAAAHATLGYVALYFEWDWNRAEAEFLRSIELSPDYSTAHQWHANFLTAMGRFEEAEAAMLRAQELDPLSLIANAALGWVYYYAGDYERTIEQCLRTMELDPEFELAHLWQGQALERLGRLEEAEAAIARAVELGGRSTITRAALARLLALHGQPARAREILAELQSEGVEDYVPSYEIARVHEALGNREGALAWLERAFEERSHSMVFMRVDPGFDGLRGDPAFEDLALRVGLADEGN